MATRSDRLSAALVKCGAATQEEIDAGKWSPSDTEPHGHCPYSIKPRKDGSTCIEIDKGEVLIRIIGEPLADSRASMESAIAKLEAKIG
jgi:hypothetical protein